MRVAIVQSNYIPWKGYFDLIRSVDTFVFLDDVQYTPRDWRNRNIIKTGSGLRWLTVPVGNVGLNRSIDSIEIPSAEWQKEHLAKLTNSYRSAPYFKLYLPLIEEFYLHSSWTSLSAMNQSIVQRIAAVLGVQDVNFVNSRSLNIAANKEEKLIKICKHIGATEYLSGPKARDYIVENNWAENGIKIIWKDYDYQEYDQLYPPFTHGVTILDLLFMKGLEASEYIWKS